MTSTTPAPVSQERGAGPLTTVFTTPDFCASLYWRDTVTPPLSSSICMPPRWKQLADYSYGFYSPGICPQSYSEGCTFPTSMAKFGLDHGWVSYGGPVLPSETVRICCPNGYKCMTDGVQTAYSKCYNTKSVGDRAFAIQVRWQASDLSILQTDPTDPGKTYQAPKTVAGGSTPIETAKATAAATTPTDGAGGLNGAKETASTGPNADSGASAGTSDSLSTWAYIGIGVGAAVVAFVVGAIAFCVWSRRKKRERAAKVPSTVGNSDFNTHAAGAVMELDSKAPASSVGISSELDTQTARAEMPSESKFYAELPGSVPPCHEKQADGDTSSRDIAEEARPLQNLSQSEPEPKALGLEKRQLAPGLSPNNTVTPGLSPNTTVSPLLVSPQSGGASVNLSVSNPTDRDDNGRAL